MRHPHQKPVLPLLKVHLFHLPDDEKEQAIRRIGDTHHHLPDFPEIGSRVTSELDPLYFPGNDFSFPSHLMLQE